MSSEETHTAIPEEIPLKEKDEAKKPELEFTEKTFLEKLKYVGANITVEPILAFLIIPSMLSKLAIQNLNLEKACRIKLDLDSDICDALIRKDNNDSLKSSSGHNLTYYNLAIGDNFTNYLHNLTYEDNSTNFNFTNSDNLTNYNLMDGDNSTNYERDAQKIISSIEAWKSIIQTAVPIFLVMFMGAWSDRTGNRKICILLPIVGEILVCISNIISTVFFKEIPVEVTMFFEGFFPAITGGWVMMYLGVFSYISDVTSPEDRTFRVGLVNLCMTAGVPLGTALSGVLLKYWGYYGIFSLSGSIYALNLAYGVIYLKSKTKVDKEDEKKTPLTCKEFVSMVKETALFAFKKREGNTRKKLIITLIIVAMLYGPGHGERIVFYYYLRYKLKWNAVKYSMYSSYNTIVHSLGALFSIYVFSKKLGYHDSVLCLISNVTKFLCSFYIAFVQTDFQMFLFPLLEILNATTWTSLRALTSKLVSSEEMGKINSLFSLVETVAALVFDPLYSGLYRLTIDWFAGFVFIFSAVMIIPALILLMWIFVKHRLDTRDALRNLVIEPPLMNVD